MNLGNMATFERGSCVTKLYASRFDFAFFKSAIITPFLKQDPRCLDVVQVVLESILLRREKTTKDKNGKSIVQLPPKEVRYSYNALLPFPC